jgi:hypothetical protein
MLDFPEANFAGYLSIRTVVSLVPDGLIQTLGFLVTTLQTFDSNLPGMMGNFSVLAISYWGPANACSCFAVLQFLQSCPQYYLAADGYSNFLRKRDVKPSRDEVDGPGFANPHMIKEHRLAVIMLLL